MGSKEWEAYYNKKDVVPFGSHKQGYYRTLEYLSRQNSSLLGSEEGRVFALGGFHPHNTTKDDFINFCRDIRNAERLGQLYPMDKDKAIRLPDSHGQDTYMLLDINEEPLIAAEADIFPEDTQPVRVQADITRLSQTLSSEFSFDFLFLDYTQPFIPDERIVDLSPSIASRLRKDGVAVMINANPSIPTLARYWDTMKNSKKVYPRKDKKIIELMSSHLKLVAHGNAQYSPGGGTYSVMGFARLDSIYKPFDGRPLFFGLSKLFK